MKHHTVLDADIYSEVTIKGLVTPMKLLIVL